MEPPYRIKTSSLVATLVLLFIIVAVPVDAEQDQSAEWIRGFNCTDCSECMNFSFYYADCTQLKKIIENNGANLINSDGFSNSTIIFDEANRRNSPAPAWDILGLINTKERNSGCAEKCHLEAIKRDGNYSLAWKHLGMILEAKNNLSGARDAYEKAASKDKSDYILFKKMGFVNQLLGKDLIAIDYYNKSLYLKNDQEIVWLNRGIAYQNLGLFTKAIESYQKTLNFNQSNIKANYYLALCYYQKENYKNATYYFRKTIKETDKGNEIYKNLVRTLADSLYHQNNFSASAIDYEDQAIKSDPEVIYNLANVYYQNGSYAKAIANYREALKTNYSLERAYYNLGLAYMIQEEYNSAIGSFDSFILKTEDKRNKSNAMAKKGICLAYNGQYCEALNELEKAQYLQPKSFEISAIKGLILAKLGSVNEALGIFTHSIKANPDNNTGINVDLYKYFSYSVMADILLTNSSNDRDCIKKAIEAYDNATNITNDGLGANWSNSSAHSNKGRALLRLHKDYDAMRSFKKAEAYSTHGTDTEKVKIFNGLGDALYRLGSYNESMNYYYKAKSLSYSDDLTKNLFSDIVPLSLSYFDLTNSLGRARNLFCDKWPLILAFIILLCFLFSLEMSSPAKTSPQSRINSLSKISSLISSIRIDLVRWPILAIFVQFGIFILIMNLFFTVDIIRDYILVAFVILSALILVWLFFGTSQDMIVNKVKIAFQEIEIEHNNMRIFSVLTMGLYLIILYFTFYDYSRSNIPQIDLFRILLGLLMVTGFFANMSVWRIICSEKCDRDTRNMASIFQFLWFGLNCLYLFRLMWSFGYTNTSYSLWIGLVERNIPVSILFLSIFVLFLIFFILPYLYGWRRAKQWRINLLQTQKDILELYSKMPTEKEPNLKLENEIYGRLSKELDKIGFSKLIQHYMHPEGTQQTTVISNICDYRNKFSSIQDSDIRFRSLCLLCLIRDNLKDGFSTAYPVLEEYRQHITAELTAENESKPQIWITLLSLLTPLVGQYIIGFITKTGIASDPSALASSISGILLNIN